MFACKQDNDVTLKFNTILAPVTRGNTYKIRQDHVRYDFRKFSFSNRVRTVWNSLPDIVVKAESVNSFKGRLDRFWNDQEIEFKNGDCRQKWLLSPNSATIVASVDRA